MKGSVRDTVLRIISEEGPKKVDELLKHKDVIALKVRQSGRIGRVLDALYEDRLVVFRMDARYARPGAAIENIEKKCKVLTGLEKLARKRSAPDVADALAEIRADLCMVSTEKVG